MSRDPERVSVTDPGWLFGATLFETLPVYDGVPYLFSQHWARLELSARQMGQRPSLDRTELERALRGSEEARPGSGRRLARVTVSASGIWTLTWRRPGVRAEQFRSGWRLCLLPPFLSNRSGIWARMKSGNHGAFALARSFVERQGMDEGIWVTQEGEVLEGAFTHLFLVTRGTLLTPSLQAPILPGVTRARVLDLVRGRTPALQRPVLLRDLWEAEEAFVTGSGVEVTPVRSVEGRLLPGGSPGPVSLEAMRLLARDVRRETGASSSIAEYLPRLIE